uniref:FMN hydroxy acid dehydrogenase domain-containing protein n=1 Tax=Heterorhabditis bacteriophora TaxID=37862 RepID=A0A1I7XM38_HETBA
MESTKFFLTVDDYQNDAKNHLEKVAHDYYESGANDEYTLKRNEAAYKKLLIRPRCLQDVSSVDTSIEWFGKIHKFPIGIAPTAFHKMACKDGELSTLKGAADTNSLMICSSWSNTSLEEVAIKGKQMGAQLWFQLYIYKDRSVTEALVSRAEAAGYQAFVLTVDTPILGRRIADMRNGFSLPKILKFANFEGNAAHSYMPQGIKGQSGFMEYVTSQIDPSLDWNTLDWLVRRTSHPVVVKGIIRGDDAKMAIEKGAKGIIVSNHGGRQMDSAPATIEALPEIVKAVGESCQVFLDGGIRNGRDVFKAIALGANGIFIGRPVLWGLSVENKKPLTLNSIIQGAKGVKNIISILQQEFTHTMKLAGCRSIQEIRKCKDLIVREDFYSKL